MLRSFFHNKNTNKTEKALKWNASYQIIENILNFTLGVIMARLLDPSEFGIISIVLIFSSFVFSFVDGGFGSAVVQSNQLKKSDLSSIFSVNLLIAFLFSCFLFLISSSLASFFENEIFSNLFKAITLLFIFQAFIVVPKNYYVRNLDFKSIASIELTSIIVSGIIAIILAVNGFKYWALAFRIIIQFFISAVLYNLSSKLKLKFELNLDVIKKYWNYSINVLSNSLFVNFKSQLDIFILSKLISTDDLGLYTRGKQYANMSQTFLYVVFNKPLFSTFSKIKEEIFLNYYCKWYKILSFIAFFSFFNLYIISDELIYLILGQKWTGSVIFLKVFSFWGILKVLLLFNFDIFNAKGKPKLNFINSLFEFILFILFILFSYIFFNNSNLAISISFCFFLCTFCSFIFQNYQLTFILKQNFLNNLFSNYVEIFICVISFLLTMFLFNYFSIDNQLISAMSKLFVFTSSSLFLAIFLRIELFKLIYKKIKKIK